MSDGAVLWAAGVPTADDVKYWSSLATLETPMSCQPVESAPLPASDEALR